MRQTVIMSESQIKEIVAVEQKLEAENARLRELLDRAELRLSSHPIRVESESKDEFLSRVAAWKRLARQTSDAIRKNRDAK